MSVIGLVNILRQLRIGRRTLRLLRHGVPNWGRVVAQEKVSVVVRRSPPIATTLAYPLEGGTSRSIRIRTARGEFADGEYCWILYDAAEPGRATVLRRAPGAPMLLRGEDQIVLQRRLYGWTAWALPLASVVAPAGPPLARWPTPAMPAFWTKARAGNGKDADPTGAGFDRCGDGA
jgi:hypothetical protein